LNLPSALFSERVAGSDDMFKFMNYLLLGRSGLRVSDLCLGTMTFGEDWGWGSAKEEAKKIYDAFRDGGGNFIDTANLYTNSTSEAFIGEFSKGH
jgi:aryl-alcohol dehydrogenase-like predicted oxidoreductase